MHGIHGIKILNVYSKMCQKSRRDDDDDDDNNNNNNNKPSHAYSVFMAAGLSIFSLVKPRSSVCIDTVISECVYSSFITVAIDDVLLRCKNARKEAEAQLRFCQSVACCMFRIR
jgi:hypothetical protein